MTTPDLMQFRPKLYLGRRGNKIRLIPQFQCFGHQSWAKETFPLLTVYPELDLTPGAFPDNEGMDEVFLITDEHAASTKDKNPAKVFAKVVKDMYGHLVNTRGIEASQAFIRYSQSFDNKNMLGHLFTTWSKKKPDDLLNYEPMLRGLSLMKSPGHYLLMF